MPGDQQVPWRRRAAEQRR